MRNCHRQPVTKTLADLYRAIDRKTCVTITYTDRDGSESIRTIEPADLRTTDDGDIVIVAMCRLRGDERNFRISRVRSYTLHRMTFVLERPAPTTYERPQPAPADDEQALFFYELARDKDDADYRPRVRLAA
ncbi:WYL domain-containing protein [Streptomyces osmaniensis]|uniref:WYL domain-containing protein n=1 Tax=Streptomyces osmaniensis TaxID=593134 RepID=A0ABP6YXR4_9ACTN|nr:WYL domain-containing protein [Streptomyces sp. JCM17656]